jgi:hypothetical protein
LVPNYRGIGMNINKKITALGVFLLLLLWTGNIAYYKMHDLKEPLFTKHFYDIKHGMNSFRLYYLQNINDNSQVINIRFPELGDTFVNFEDSKTNNGRRYYKLKQLYITLRSMDPNNLSDAYKDKILTKAEIQFNNGKMLEIDIGKIYLYSSADERPVLKTYSSSGSSDNTGSTTFGIDGNLKVKGVYCKFPELLETAMSISINGHSLNQIKFPLELKQGNNLTLSHSYNFEKNDIRRNYAYHFTIDTLTEDDNGEQGYSYAYTHYWLQFPDAFDIKALKKERGE